MAKVPKGKRKIARRAAPPVVKEKPPRRDNVRKKRATVPLDAIEFNEGDEPETTRAAVILSGMSAPDRKLLLQEILRKLIAGRPKRVQLAVVRDIARSVDGLMRLTQYEARYA